MSLSRQEAESHMTQAKSTKKFHLNKKSCNFVSFFFSPEIFRISSTFQMWWFIFCTRQWVQYLLVLFYLKLQWIQRQRQGPKQTSQQLGHAFFKRQVMPAEAKEVPPEAGFNVNEKHDEIRVPKSVPGNCRRLYMTFILIYLVMRQMHNMCE